MKKYLFIFLVLQFSANVLFCQNADSTRALDLFHEGVFLYNQDKYYEAISKFESAIKINKKMAEAYFRNGLAYQQLDLHQEVISNYTKAISLNPAHHSAYEYRAYAYMQLEYYQNAIADYNKAIQMDSLSSCMYADRGSAKFALKNFNGAIKDYEHLLEMDSKSDAEVTRAHFLKGKAHYYAKNMDAAISDFHAVVTRDSLNAEAFLYLGYIGVATGYYSEAITYLDKCLEIDKSNSEALYLRGYCKYDLGMDDLGEADLQKSAGLGDKDAKWMIKKYF